MASKIEEVLVVLDLDFKNGGPHLQSGGLQQFINHLAISSYLALGRAWVVNILTRLTVLRVDSATFRRLRRRRLEPSDPSATMTH